MYEQILIDIVKEEWL